MNEPQIWFLRKGGAREAALDFLKRSVALSTSEDNLGGKIRMLIHSPGGMFGSQSHPDQN